MLCVLQPITPAVRSPDGELECGVGKQSLSLPQFTCSAAGGLASTMWAILPRLPSRRGGPLTEEVRSQLVENCWLARLGKDVGDLASCADVV